MEYTNEIFFKSEIIKTKLEFISKFLKNDERILLGVSGYVPMRIFERLYSGIIDILINKKCVFLFTNKRIFCIHIKVNYSYKNIIQEIFYEDIKTIEFKKGRIIIQYKNLKKDIFRIKKNLPDEIIKEIKGYIKNENNFYISGRHYICPRCGNKLTKGTYICSKCNLEFINKEKVIKYSIFILAAFYLFNKSFINYLLFLIVTTIELALLFLIFVFLYTEYFFGNGINLADIFYALIILISIPLSGYTAAKLLDDFIPKKNQL